MRSVALYLVTIFSAFPVAAIAQDSGYQVVDAADLKVGSQKYIGKNIEVRNVRCYYADVSDYRCTTPALVSVFTKQIEPENVRKWIEEKCDAARKVFEGPNCLTHIRFTYADPTSDLVDGYQRRIIIHPESAKLALPNVARDRKR